MTINFYCGEFTVSEIKTNSGKTFAVTKVDDAIVAHRIVDDGAVFVAMLCGDFFKAEIQYYNYDGVMLGTFPEDVDEYFGSGEVEEVKNELKKLLKQDEKENKEISRQ